MYQPLSIEKEMHNPKSSIKFYLGNLPRNIAWESASQTALSNCSKEVREESGYIVIFAGEKMYLNIKKLLLITKNRTLEDFIACLCIGRYKCLGSLIYFFDMNLGPL